MSFFAKAFLKKCHTLKMKWNEFRNSNHSSAFIMFLILKICQYLNMQIECQSKFYSHTLSWWRRSSCWTWRLFWTAWIWAQNKAKWIEFHTTLGRKKTDSVSQVLVNTQSTFGQVLFGYWSSISQILIEIGEHQSIC